MSTNQGPYPALLDPIRAALAGDWLEAEVLLHALSDDDLNALANDLDDLRNIIDRVPEKGS